jgi:uncharacterized damage-inducible protein DinB
MGELEMNEDKLLREHLQKLLDWEDAHTGFDSAVKGIPMEKRGIKPQGFPYSIWQILEHMRICQFDILDFCVNEEYEESKMDEFWPKTADPPDADAWDESIAAFRKNRKALRELTENSSIDLFAKIPHGTGQTYLRELLLVADHNAYHIADLVALRRVLGIWK